MITYIIKSCISLLLLFGVYWFILRNEKSFVFNRFYLLASIFFSLIVPLIPVNTISLNTQLGNSVKNIVLFDQLSVQRLLPQNFHDSFDVVSNSSDNSLILLKILLLLFYISVVLVLLFRFLRNIYKILVQIRSSDKVRYDKYNIALIESRIIPHCFFNTIFISKKDFLENSIDEDLLCHECVHIRQKHSIDLILLELVMVFSWFNPILLLYRRAVILNHEYLSDKGVMQNRINVRSYSEKLLNFVTSNNSIPLTCGFNQSFTMKRVVMLTKPNSMGFMPKVKTFCSLCLTFLVLLSCVHKVNLPSAAKDSSIPNGLTSPKEMSTEQVDSIMSDLENNTSIIKTNLDRDLQRWDPILKKHKINLNDFNYKMSFEKKSYDTVRVHYLELGTLDSEKDQFISLKNAILLVEHDLGSDYWIIKAQSLLHNFKDSFYKAEYGSMENYCIDTPIDKPLGGHEFKKLNDYYKKSLMYSE